MTEATSIEEETPEAPGLQRQLLTRAGMAAGLIVVLLAGLAAYDHMNRVAVPPPAPPSAQAPQVPPTPEATPGTLGAPPLNSLADGDLRQEVPSEPELSSAPELAPPGKRQTDAPEPRRGAPRLVLGGEPPPSRAARPTAGVPAAEVPAAAKGYVIQLGVFASLENAEALRARLEGLGIPARLESRVVVGPFPDQAAARAAQVRLRDAGQEVGLIVPPRR
jgi:DedD protein